MPSHSENKHPAKRSPKKTAKKTTRKQARKSAPKKAKQKKRLASENPRKNEKRKWWWAPANWFENKVFDANGPAWFEKLGSFLIKVTLLALIGFITFVTFYTVRAQNQPLDTIGDMSQRTILLDRRGEEIGHLHGQNRILVDLDQISPYLRMAVLAREDSRFYDHGGVDLRGFARAIFRNIKDRRMTQGASTLTMQLARNSFSLGKGNPLRELDRKFLEIAVAYRIEREYTKDEILEFYLNRIFWGHRIFGVESAARTYYQKKASELTLAESALLAGIIRGPNSFSPFRSEKAANSEKSVVLKRMVELNYIKESDRLIAEKEKIKITPKSERYSVGNYALDSIRRDLTEIFQGDSIDDGGLRVQTTLDLEIQRAAQKAVDSHLTKIEASAAYKNQTRKAWNRLPASKRKAPQYLQGACVIIENETGNVLAMVGGRNFEESQYNRAIQSRRQIGSIFKPFVFLAAFDQGVTSRNWVSDEPLKKGEIDRAPTNWNPRNSDGRYYKKIMVSQALIQSRNTSSIRIGNYAGIEAVREVARNAGFLGRIKKGNVSGLPTRASIYLGAWEASPWEVASAYSIFASGGARNRPHLIDSIKDIHGNERLPNGDFTYQASTKKAAHDLTKLLERAVNEGTGKNIRKMGLTFPVAGKTGTTNDFRDAWFAGYTQNITCAVWVGMDNNSKIMDGGFGSKLALPIWAEIMKSIHKTGHYPMGEISKPSKMHSIKLCRISGGIANPHCKALGFSYVARLPKNMIPHKNQICTLHKEDEAKAKKTPFIKRLFNIFR